MKAKPRKVPTKTHAAFRLCPVTLNRLRYLSERTTISQARILEGALKEYLTKLESKYL